jgi:nucleoside-diphosphate-sugar epimerase
VQGACLRLSNIYGPGSASSSAERGILNTMIKAALGGRPLTVFGDGDYYRDYVFIDDAIRALLLIPEHAGSTSGQMFLVATGVPTTIRQMAGAVAHSVQKLTGRAVEVRHAPLPAGWTALDERKFVGSSRKLFQACGWRPEVSFDEGVDRTARYFF